MATAKKMMTKDEIVDSIKSIESRGKKMDADIQRTAISILAHIEQHKEVSLFNKLYNALPKGARKSALTGWGLAFGKLEANAGDDKKEAPFKYSRDKTTNLAQAAANPWYDFAPEKAPDEMFDVRKALTALLNRAGKANNVNDADLLAKLRQLETVED